MSEQGTQNPAGTGAWSLHRRVSSSLFWSVSGHFLAEAMRLGSNLVLTRLLFPEAFGLMALIMAVMVALTLFSDIGIGPAIQQNRRADEPAFLNTAWSIQIIRGVVLWLAACALALPMAAFYGQPELAQILPVAALSLVIAGFRPTRFESSARHLQLGRATQVNLAAQAAALVVTIALAWYLRSVWALAFGAVIGELFRVLALHFFMPGHVDRFRFERASARELISFGKWIFLSTACAFLISHADRLILGHYLTLEMLGIFSIGLMIALFPNALAGAVTNRMILPIYRECPPAASAANFRTLRRMRAPFTAGLLLLTMGLALGGPWLIDLLYDPRYQLAGPVVVLAALTVLLQLVGFTYDSAALAAGDGRGFFRLLAWRAVLQTVFFIIGIELAGLGGALVGQALSVVAVYGLLVALARRHGAWDALNDLLAFVAALAIGALALWMHLDLITPLFTPLTR